MDTSSTFAVFGDSATTMLSALVFLATGTLAFAVMLGIRAREAVRRRAARVNIDDDASGNGRRSLRYSGVRAAQKLVAYTTKHYSSVDSKDVKMLRARLVQAGVYNPHGTAYFFLARGAGALGLALAACFVLPMFGIVTTLSFWLFVMVGGVLGYLVPSFYLDRRIKGKRLEHQAGFPGFSDALRVYSDDMPHKRLSRAEEKAYSLPAKLAIPMMVCIFPVLFVVILCPVIVRMVTGTW